MQSIERGTIEAESCTRDLNPLGPLRVCLVCGLEAYTDEDLELFTKCKKSKYGRMNHCKKCTSLRQLRYSKAIPEKVKERNKKYYKANREKIIESNRKYREANIEKARERAKKHYWVNRDKKLKYANEYAKSHQKEIKEYRVKWREANPFESRSRVIKRKCRDTGLDFNLDGEYIEQMWNESVGICPMTGIKMLKTAKKWEPLSMSVDRIIPDKGYTKGNVRLVSLWYNVVRNKWGDKFTLEMCKRVTERARKF